MVLHRPIECTRLTGEVDTSTPNLRLPEQAYRSYRSLCVILPLMCDSMCGKRLGIIGGMAKPTARRSIGGRSSKVGYFRAFISVCRWQRMCWACNLSMNAFRLPASAPARIPMRVGTKTNNAPALAESVEVFFWALTTTTLIPNETTNTAKPYLTAVQTTIHFACL